MPKRGRAKGAKTRRRLGAPLTDKEDKAVLNAWIAQKRANDGFEPGYTLSAAERSVLSMIAGSMSGEQIVAYVADSVARDTTTVAAADGRKSEFDVGTGHVGSLPPPGFKFLWFETDFEHRNAFDDMVMALRGPPHLFDVGTYRSPFGETQPVPPAEVQPRSWYSYLMVPAGMVEALDAECSVYFDGVDRAKRARKDSAAVDDDECGSGYRLVQLGAPDHFKVEVCGLKLASEGMGVSV